MYRILYILEQDHSIVLHAQISARFFKVQLELVLQVPQQFEEAYRFPTDTIFISVQLSYICPLVDILHHPLMQLAEARPISLVTIILRIIAVRQQIHYKSCH